MGLIENNNVQGAAPSYAAYLPGTSEQDANADPAYTRRRDTDEEAPELRKSNGVPNSIEYDPIAHARTYANPVGVSINSTASTIPAGMEEFMPQRMPSAPNLPQRPQRPGAYRGSHGDLERNSSLYKGGARILGRESETVPVGDSTRYVLTSHEQAEQETSPEFRSDRDLLQVPEGDEPRIIHIIPSQRDVIQQDNTNNNNNSTSKELEKVKQQRKYLQNSPI